ncbi:sigma 54-interacting transcriptional regulator [Candidatus Micrarchaeota archaeon]|nr:sigma 54-interacting transcriptional regulator [Candidatus Micrarchaeota archaeon]
MIGQRPQEDIARGNGKTEPLRHLIYDLQKTKESVAPEDILRYIVGEGPEISQLKERIRISARVNMPVLILGETGTGKELVAMALHLLSPRAKGPYITVDCTAIGKDLAASDLFGHVRGSFTGAIAEREGKFHAAHSGTIFLDEIAELDQAVQAKLLRVIHAGEYDKVGANIPQHVDVKVIAATNRDVNGDIFRLDLRHRLGFHITTPPLRQRIDDIPLLANYFLTSFKDKYGVQIELAKESYELLKIFSYPGNIRQLRNIVEWAATFAMHYKKDIISRKEIDDALRNLAGMEFPETLRPEDRLGMVASYLPDLDVRTNEMMLILEALRRTEGSTSRASKLLGISTRTVQYHIRALADALGMEKVDLNDLPIGTILQLFREQRGRIDLRVIARGDEGAELEVDPGEEERPPEAPLAAGLPTSGVLEVPLAEPQTPAEEVSAPAVARADKAVVTLSDEPVPEPVAAAKPRLEVPPEPPRAESESGAEPVPETGRTTPATEPVIAREAPYQAPESETEDQAELARIREAARVLALLDGERGGFRSGRSVAVSSTALPVGRVRRPIRAERVGSAAVDEELARRERERAQGWLDPSAISAVQIEDALRAQDHFTGEPITSAIAGAAHSLRVQTLTERMRELGIKPEEVIDAHLRQIITHAFTTSRTEKEAMKKLDAHGRRRWVYQQAQRLGIDPDKLIGTGIEGEVPGQVKGAADGEASAGAKPADASGTASGASDKFGKLTRQAIEEAIAAENPFGSGGFSKSFIRRVAQRLGIEKLQLEVLIDEYGINAKSLFEANLRGRFIDALETSQTTDEAATKLGYAHTTSLYPYLNRLGIETQDHLGKRMDEGVSRRVGVAGAPTQATTARERIEQAIGSQYSFEYEALGPALHRVARELGLTNDELSTQIKALQIDAVKVFDEGIRRAIIDALETSRTIEEAAEKLRATHSGVIYTHASRLGFVAGDHLGKRLGPDGVIKGAVDGVTDRDSKKGANNGVKGAGSLTLEEIGQAFASKHLFVKKGVMRVLPRVAETLSTDSGQLRRRIEELGTTPEKYLMSR